MSTVYNVVHCVDVVDNAGNNTRIAEEVIDGGVVIVVIVEVAVLQSLLLMMLLRVIMKVFVGYYTLCLGDDGGHG